MNKKIFLSILLIFFLLGGKIYSQFDWWKDKKYGSKDQQLKFDNCKYTFVNIADGFMYGNVSYIIPYFQNEVYISIKNEDKGYYNIDQARYIIEEFLGKYSPDSFKWKKSTRSESFAFANGKYIYKKDGYQNRLYVSVSLKYIDELWLIDQIVIN